MQLRGQSRTQRSMNFSHHSGNLNLSLMSKRSWQTTARTQTMNFTKNGLSNETQCCKMKHKTQTCEDPYTQTTNSIKTVCGMKHYVQCNCVGKSRSPEDLNFSHHSGNLILSLLSTDSRRQRKTHNLWISLKRSIR